MQTVENTVTTLLDGAPAFSRQRGRGLFLVVQGPDRGEVLVVADRVLVVGSGADCDLALTDKTISRRHLEVVGGDGEVVLRDLGSKNGTYLGGARFREVAVGYGAEVKLGRTVLKYMPDEEAVEPAQSDRDRFGQIFGRDPKMRKLFALLQDVAETDATVIIEGETGTGKELVAEELHRASRRRNGPFVVFDCGAVPRELIESLLLGHLKGSFTGATSDRKGAFAEAHGGTLFIDEIGDLPIHLQPALLRALDKKMVRPIGATQYEAVDVRVVAATNKDLRAQVAQKAFREDLYYRLAVVRVTLPPLRERGSDIVPLAEHFVRQFARRPLALTPADGAALQRHGWPGNVRELRNAIERACLLAKSDALDLSEAFAGAREVEPGVRVDLPFKEAKALLVEHFEREYLSALLRRHRMNLSAAARQAEIDRKHLRELIRKYALDPRGEVGDAPDGPDASDDGGAPA